MPNKKPKPTTKEYGDPTKYTQPRKAKLEGEAND